MQRIPRFPRGSAFFLAGGRLPAVPCILRATSSTEPPTARDGTVVALQAAMSVEVVIGRAVAHCAHPSISWRCLPASGRVLLVAAYVSASYLTILTILFIM